MNINIFSYTEVCYLRGGCWYNYYIGNCKLVGCTLSNYPDVNAYSFILIV